MDGKIKLFGVFTFCRKGADDFKAYKINRTIGRDNRILKMTREDQKEDQYIEDEKNDLKTLTSFDINYSFLEWVWIVFVNISLISFMASLFSFDKEYNLLGMLFSTLFSASVGIVFNIVFLKLYKCLLICEMKEQIKMDSSLESVYTISIRVYYMITIVTAIGLGLFTGYISTNRKDIDTYRWVCVTFCAISIFALVYRLFSNINLCKPKPKSELSEETTVSSIESHENR